MCGIVSIFAYKPGTPPVERSELLRIRDRMITRGPDGAGEWYSADKCVGMGHRRLSIIDLTENGAQPMRTADNSLVITFNGEIYNYQELRSRLEQKGYQFRSTSDTEVLLHLYADRGREMVHDLRGMYAFAIWDDRLKGMFLARDPFGIKPLYYADDGKTFRAASQVKALLAGGAIDTTSEPAGHVGYYLWGYVPEPFSLYKSIRSLPAGASLWVDADGMRIPEVFYSICHELKLASAAAEVTMTPEEQRIRLRTALVDSVRHHLIADVPVAVFLSSGIDSSTLAALASETGAKLHTVTLGFEELRGTSLDETSLAELTARQYGARHQTVWVTKQDFVTEYEKLLDAMDQPSSDGVNSYFVSLAAARVGMKVALSGLGADELFGGYPSFRQLPRMVRLFKPFSRMSVFGRASRMVTASLLGQFTSPKYAGLFEYAGTWGGAYLLRRAMYMPWEMNALLDEEIVRKGWADLQAIPCLNRAAENIQNNFLKVSALEMKWYMRNQLLRDVDWASMAHSLEVRVPFLDLNLLRALAPLLYSREKPDKQMLASTPSKPLSKSVTSRLKTGFAVPIRNWLVRTEETEPIERGLRSWTKSVYKTFVGDQRRVLALIPDAFGGIGGIALYNRDLLSALSKNPNTESITAIPRIMPLPSEPQPKKLKYITQGLNSKFAYTKTVFSAIMKNPRYDLVICGHINLLPIAMVVSRWLNAPVLLEIYGIDAWQSPNNFLVRYLVFKVNGFISISEITKTRFLAWSRVPPEKGFIVPNAIHQEKYGPGAKNPVLISRYNLQGKKIIMTLGRLVSEERYKGFDEILEVLPALLQDIPDIAYLIVGDGSDRGRLEKKAQLLGVRDKVVFAGYIPEIEKTDHYRLADVYVMPSRGEGFGFVFLEAMACGIPVIASSEDGGREAVRNGALGTLINPTNADELKTAILAAMKLPISVPEGLAYYSFENFSERMNTIVNLLGKSDFTSRMR